MMKTISEYDFYMENEDQFINESDAVVLAIMELSTHSNLNEVLLSKLEELSDIVEIPIRVVDISNSDGYLVEELNLHGTPSLVIYKGGEEVERFDCDIRVDYVFDYIIEMQNNLDSDEL